MRPVKEELTLQDKTFPVDIFIADSCEKIIDSESHWHDCMEVLYVIEGSAVQQVNDKKVTVIKNDVIILNRGDIHATCTIQGEDVRILVIKFLNNVLDVSFSNLFESKYISAFINNRNNQIFHLADTSRNFSEMHSLLMGLYEEYINKKPGFELYIKGYLFQLIALCLRDEIIKTPLILHRNSEGTRINTIIKYIEDNYKEDINLQDMSKLLNLSYFYCSRYFKKITGKTFKEYLDFVRVCESERLIVASKMTISEAALEVGYSRVSSYNRVFKKVRGYAPGAIKKTKTEKF